MREWWGVENSINIILDHSFLGAVGRDWVGRSAVHPLAEESILLLM